MSARTTQAPFFPFGLSILHSLCWIYLLVSVGHCGGDPFNAPASRDNAAPTRCESFAPGTEGDPEDPALSVASRPGFYFWKVAEALPRKRDLAAYGVKRLHVRYFDVVQKKGAPGPVGVRREVNTDLDVVPVVYITTEALKDLSESQMEELAGNIWKLVKNLRPPDGEIQLDCDWNESTRLAFFQLIEKLRQAIRKDDSAARIQISATIRLHQVKYFKRTGVPPVDRGALMIYNMGDLADPKESNSIFCASTAASYLDHPALSDYPLPLDIALPDFHWTLAFVHGAFHTILPAGPEELKKAPLEKTDEGRFRLKKEAIIAGKRLPKGAVLRYESVDHCQRLEVLKILARRLPADPFSHSPVADAPSPSGKVANPEWNQPRSLIVFDYQAEKKEGMQDLIDLFRAAGAL